MTTRNLVAWDEIEETMSPSGVGKREFAGLGASLVRVLVPAGASASRHSHPHEQFVQVISGKGRLETEQGGWQDFGPGSLFHFPADTWHAAEFAAETVLVETNLGEARAPS